MVSKPIEKVRLPMGSEMGLVREIKDEVKTPGLMDSIPKKTIETIYALRKDVLAPRVSQWTTRSRGPAVSVETLSVVPGTRRPVRNNCFDHSPLKKKTTMSITGMTASVCHMMKTLVRRPRIFGERFGRGKGLR
jgi:hypothetical protein